MMARPRPVHVVFWVSVCLMITAAAAVLLGQWRIASEANVATVGSRDLASLAAEFGSPESSPGEATSTDDPGIDRAGSAPVKVRIPALDVSATVLPVGLDENTALEVPEDITKVGWYEPGVFPGAGAGSAVLVAHRDGREQGRGVFYGLGTLEVGDRVVVEDADGTELAFRVVARESISKKALPLGELFALDGPSRLTLISCGGYYDRDNGGYQDNVVVTAVPIGRV